MSRTRFAMIAATAAVFAIVPAGLLRADGLTVPPIADPIVAKECSACHMLYPAGLLPSRSWSGVMAGLKDHFGDNAELTPELTRHVEGYLTANAADARGRGGKVLRDLPSSAAPLRVTELPWWRRKHEKKDRVSPATLKRKGAKFAGDCVACHKDAAKGYFDDD